ncbi:hypothetical protein GCM10017673_23060 [Streptosporangium violaceochromogenes]|nr:hypothetical protein GCM10017673_23060 [Streptosporangium violaceochromogenes]
MGQATARARIGWDKPLPVPEITGSKAIYRGAVDGGDLILEALPEGFSQQIVLPRPPDRPVHVTMPLTLPKGMKYSQTAKRVLRVTGPDGKVAAVAAPMQMQDATAAASPDAGRRATATTTVTQAGTTARLHVQADDRFLADPAVQYPVTLSTNEWVGAGLKVDTFVSSDYPGSQTAVTWLHVGKFDHGAKTAHSYIRFNVGRALHGATILNADLRLSSYKSNACGAVVGSGVQVRRITGDWTPSTLTLSHQPPTTTLGAVTVTSGYGAPDCAENLIVYSVEEIVRDWVNGAGDYGFQLRSAHEADATNWRMYRSSESGTTGPSLFIDFTNPSPATVELAVTEESGSIPLDGQTFAYDQLYDQPGVVESDLNRLHSTGVLSDTMDFPGENTGEDWPQTSSPTDPPITAPQPEEPMSDVPAAKADTMNTAANDERYKLLFVWRERDNKKVYYRQGFYTVYDGFGDVKIQQKHNLNMRAVRATTQSKMPGGKRQQTMVPSRWEYDTIAYRVQCDGMLWWRTCKKTESKRVRAVVSYTTDPDVYAGTFGVITAFCLGVTRCPNYVKNAVNIR